jgi:hypothetical protein
MLDFLVTEFKSKLNFYFNNHLVFYFVFFFFISFYIRLDAELMIFWSVLLVLFTVWNSLSDFLANILNIKITLYYFYFIRFYQGRLWFIYLSHKYFTLNLFLFKLPFFFKWYKFYTKRSLDLLNSAGINTFKNWDVFLNYFILFVLRNSMSLVWINFYRLILNLFFFKDNYVSKLNSRKLAEYVLLNKNLFIS